MPEEYRVVAESQLHLFCDVSLLKQMKMIDQNNNRGRKCEGKLKCWLKTTSTFNPACILDYSIFIHPNVNHHSPMKNTGHSWFPPGSRASTEYIDMVKTYHTRKITQVRVIQGEWSIYPNKRIAIHHHINNAISSMKFCRLPKKISMVYQGRFSL